jgi:ABC-2 type transport system permease protein
MNTVAVPLGPAATGATALRVLTQLRRDPRTVALLLLVPALLMTLLRYVFDGQPETFDRVGAPLIGLFPFITMFLVTSITMLRERTGGTLERLMSMPMAKLDLLSGYGLAFAPSRPSRRGSRRAWPSSRLASTSKARPSPSSPWPSETPFSACRSACS